MNFRQLEIFRAVFRHQSTVGAARELMVSQPAISNGLRHLEDHLQLQLFDRVGNRLVPRDAARILYDKSEAVFLMKQAFDDSVEDLQRNRVGRVRLAATPQFGHSFLPGAITRLRAGREDVRVDLDVRQAHHVVESVETGAADVGFALGLADSLEKTVEMESLGSVDMVCVLTRTHPLAGERTLSPIQLADHSLIGLDLATMLGPLVRDSFRRCSVDYAPGIQVRYSESACLLAQAGSGIAVVDTLTAAMMRQSPDVVVVPFAPTVTVGAKAIFPKGRPRNDLAQHLFHDVRCCAERGWHDCTQGSSRRSVDAPPASADLPSSPDDDQGQQA